MVGILPLASHRNAEFLHNEVPGMSIPAEYRERMAKVGAGPAARAEGIRIAQEALAAVKQRVAGAYVMPPFNRVDSALAVLEVARDRWNPARSTAAREGARAWVPVRVPMAAASRRAIHDGCPGSTAKGAKGGSRSPSELAVRRSERLAPVLARRSRPARSPRRSLARHGVMAVDLCRCSKSCGTDHAARLR